MNCSAYFSSCLSPRASNPWAIIVSICIQKSLLVINVFANQLQRYNFFLKPPNFMAFFRLQSQKFPFFMLFWGVSSLMPERTTRWESWLMLRLCYTLAEWTFWRKRWTFWHESGQIGRDLGLGTFIAILRVKTQLRILRKTRTLRKLR